MNYYVNRLAQTAITFFTAMFIAYALFRLMPGGPVQAMISREIQQRFEDGGGNPTEAEIQAIVESVERNTGINPEAGVVEGFVGYMQGIIFELDFGHSIAYSREPVFDLMFRFMPWSVFVSGYSLLLGFTGVLLIGTLMAWKEGTKLDSGLTVTLLATNSIPYFVVGVLLLSLLGYQWELLPQGGRYPQTATPGFNWEFMKGVVLHAIMPIGSTMVVAFVGALNMRANAVRIMGSEYIRSAQLRGISTNRILTRYLLRNSVLPLYTGLAIGIAGVFSSNVVMERIFQYPGMGWITVEALIRRDYPLLMGSFVFFTGITVVALVVADLTYGLIDPRAGTGESREAY